MEPNVKLSHPERATEHVRCELPSARSSTPAAKRLGVGCSALLDRIYFFGL